jgi:hypothetical protein
VVAPERVEHFLEGTELLVTLDEQRATGVKDLVTRADVHVRERLCQIENSTDRDIEADPSQEPTEGDQIFDEVARRV